MSQYGVQLEHDGCTVAAAQPLWRTCFCDVSRRFTMTSSTLLSYQQVDSVRYYFCQLRYIHNRTHFKHFSHSLFTFQLAIYLETGEEFRGGDRTEFAHQKSCTLYRASYVKFGR